MNRLLLVEDDQKLSLLITRALKAEKFEVVPVSTPEQLDATIEVGRAFDLLVLDRLLGQLDTRGKLPAMRARWKNIPILMISTINTPLERADLINEGADDYLGKPFLTQELIARVRSLLRRIPHRDLDKRKVGRAYLELSRRRLCRGEASENLPPREFMLLEALSSSPGRVVSRFELLETVWGSLDHSENNLVEATVANLRKRVQALGCGVKIKNQRNLGYWIES